MNSKVEIIHDVSYRLLSALVILCIVLIAIFAGIFFWRSTASTLPAVLIFGMLGSFISLQRRLKELSEEDLMLIRDSRAFTWLAPVAGAVMAGVLYLLFISELLSGDLFPSFSADPNLPDGTEGILVLFLIQGASAAVYAKLLFWSFVAGFSERFVTDIIGQFTSDATIKKVS